MTTLLTVADYAAQQAMVEGSKFTTPQKINYAIRKQGAPYVKEGAKRMIDPEAFEQWASEQQDTVRAAKAEGLSPEGVATKVQARTGIKKGTPVMWRAGREGQNISGGFVESANPFYAGIRTDNGPHTPFNWQVVDELVKEGHMVKVARPEDMLYTLMHHYKAEGNISAGETLEALYQELTGGNR